MICPKCGWDIIKNAYDTELDHWLFEMTTEMQERNFSSGEIKAESPMGYQSPSEERTMKVCVGAYEKCSGRGYDLHLSVSDEDRKWLLRQLRNDDRNSLEAELRVLPPQAQMISAPKEEELIDQPVRVQKKIRVGMCPFLTSGVVSEMREYGDDFEDLTIECTRDECELWDASRQKCGATTPESNRLSAPFIAETEEDQFTGLDRSPVQEALGEAIRKGRLPTVGDVGGGAQSGYRAPSSMGIVVGVGLMSIPFIYSCARHMGWLK